MKKLIIPGLLAALAAPAVADPNPGNVTGIATWLNDIRHGKLHRLEFPEVITPDASGMTPCLASVNEFKKAGQTTLRGGDELRPFGGTSLYDGLVYEIPLAKAEEICRLGATYAPVTKANDISTLAVNDVELDNEQKHPASEESYRTRLENISECYASVKVVVSNAPPTLPYPLSDRIKTVADLTPAFCDHAKQVFQVMFDGFKAEHAKEQEPFVKAGIKGDKLDLMMEYDGSVFLPGQKSSDDLKKYAASSVLFTWSTSDPDDEDFVTHTVRRYQFKGNTLVKSTEKSYRRKNGAALGSAPFK